MASTKSTGGSSVASRETSDLLPVDQSSGPSDGANPVEDMVRLRKIFKLDDNAALSDINFETLRAYLFGDDGRPWKTLHPAKYEEIEFTIRMNKAILNDRDAEGLTFLHRAVDYEYGESGVVQLLLHYGADPGRRSDNDRSETTWQALARRSSDPHRSSDDYYFLCSRLVLQAHRLLQVDADIVITISTFPQKNYDDQYYRGSLWRNTLLELLADRSQWNSLYHPRQFEDIDSVQIHFPSNNAVIILATVRALARRIVERYNLSGPHRFRMNKSSGSGGTHSETIFGIIYYSFWLPAIPSYQPSLNYREHGYSFAEITGQTQVKCSAIVFPCLALDTVKNWRQKREENMKLQCLLNPSSYPDPLGVYSDRTLDEAYYPSLSDEFLEQRNATQVVQKQYRRVVGGRRQRKVSDPILMVPQLWLWSINDFLLSSYSMESVHDGRPSFGRFQGKTRTIDLQMLDIIIEHIEAFGKSYLDRSTGQPFPPALFPPTLATFETALVAILSDVQEYMTKRESQEIDIKSERELLEAISDFRNELDMIKTVMQQQRDVLNDYLSEKMKNAPRKAGAQEIVKELEDLELRLKNIDSPHAAGGNDRKEDLETKIRDTRVKVSANEKALEDFRNFRNALEEAMSAIAKYNDPIAKLDRDAEKLVKTIDDMLNLSRIEASIQEARNSVVIGWAALAFAIITVIFTPLSFAASLMALPVDRFVDNQYGSGSGGDDGDSTRVFKSGYIARTFVQTEFAALIVTGGIVAILYWFFAPNRRERKRKVVERTRRGVAKASERIHVTVAEKTEPADEGGALSKTHSKGGFLGSLKRRTTREKDDEEAQGC